MSLGASKNAVIVQVQIDNNAEVFSFSDVETSRALHVEHMGALAGAAVVLFCEAHRHRLPVVSTGRG